MKKETRAQFLLAWLVPFIIASIAGAIGAGNSDVVFTGIYIGIRVIPCILIFAVNKKESVGSRWPFPSKEAYMSQKIARDTLVRLLVTLVVVFIFSVFIFHDDFFHSFKWVTFWTFICQCIWPSKTDKAI